jgi:tetratricopeptide (TPR) repeat protein
MRRADATLVQAFLAVLLAASLLAATPARGQDPAAERLFREAARLATGGDPQAALEEFLLLVQQFPGDRLAARALLEIIQLRHRAGDDAGTRAALTQLLAAYPRTVESATGFVLQAEIEMEQATSREDLEEARKNFRRVPLLYGRERFPALPDRSKARIKSGEISLLLGDPGLAAAELLAAVEDEPPSPWTGRARLRLGTAFLHQGEWIAAAEILQRLAAEGDPPEGGLVNLAPTSSAEDRGRAGRLLSFIYRHRVRPAAGQRRWLAAHPFPASGLTLREPSGVAAQEDGRVLIVDGRSDLAALVGGDGEVLERRTVEDAARPGWTAGGVPYVATQTGIELLFDDQRTSFLEPRPGKEAALKGLQAAELGPFGHWFIVAKGWKGLLSYETRRKGQELLATDRPELVDLASDSQGRLYALDRRARNVSRIGVDRRSQGVVVQGGSWKRPEALAVDRLGNIYVVDRGSRIVRVYDAGGQSLAALGPQLGGGIELRAPVDLAVDGAGRLFIADEKLPFVVVLE